MKVKKTVRSSPQPDDLSIDDWRNWNFDHVPLAEWEPCCRWEYMRESAAYREAVQRVKSAAYQESKRKWEEEMGGGNGGFSGSFFTAA
jgi:hypothetical protein